MSDTKIVMYSVLLTSNESKKIKGICNLVLLIKLPNNMEKVEESARTFAEVYNVHRIVHVILNSSIFRKPHVRCNRSSFEFCGSQEILLIIGHLPLKSERRLTKPK